MSNTNQFIDMVGNEALRQFTNNNIFSKNVTRDYDNDFGVEGAKIGSVLRVRVFDRYKVVDGADLVVQDSDEETVNVTITDRKHIAMSFTTQEATLEVSGTTSRLTSSANRKIGNAFSKLASKIDSDGLAKFADISNQVGTQGTTPNTALVWLNAHATLSNFAVPLDSRIAAATPFATAATVNALTGLFQSSERIKSQYEKGLMGQGLGGDFVMTQNISSHLTGTFAGTVLVDEPSGVTSGDTVITMDAFTAGAPAIKKGDVFTIADVNSINPDNGNDTGVARQFVVTADVTGGSNEVTVAISPAMIDSTDEARQTVTALPADGAAVTWAGTEDTAGPINIVYHPEAFALVMAPLEMPGGVALSTRVDHDGYNLRVVSSYDINSDRTPTRTDVLYGWSTLRPDAACRVLG
jgi:hypothetical protein